METEEILVAIQNAAETIAKPNCAAWLSALAALGAVAVAIIVAVKQNNIAKKQNEIVLKQAEFADQQNRISLFEKRYEIYQLAIKCINMAHFLEFYCFNNLNEFYKDVFFRFDEIVMENQNTGKDRAVYAIINIADRLYQSEFLFSSEVSSQICLLAEGLRSFAFLEYNLQSNKEFKKTKEHYCHIASTVKSNNILVKMKSELQPILTR